MSITRITEFQARPGTIEALCEFLESILPGISASEGNQSTRLLQGHDDSTRFLVVEEWASIDAHQASVKNITPSSLARVMELLAGPPRGDYFLSPAQSNSHSPIAATE